MAKSSVMIQITHVLCPVDFSEFSRRAVDHAAAVARWYRAKLTVLHVFPNLPVLDLPPVVMGAEERERIAAALRRFTSHVPADVPLEFHIEEASDIHRAILGQAEARAADLLVIGSHGRWGFERLLLGSVTEKVIRKAPCPTMVVPRHAPDASPDEPVQFRRVLCPVDFSDASIRAAEYALAVAEEADAQLTLLHVIEIPLGLREYAPGAEISLDSIRDAREADCRRRLGQLIPEQARAYCTVEIAIREGGVHREILKVAGERHADLIVMGVQGRSAIDRITFGSNTARVTRGATCPVLIVRG